jgi:hypothetical protein
MVEGRKAGVKRYSMIPQRPGSGVEFETQVVYPFAPKQ